MIPASETASQAIVVDEIMPHAPATVWRVLTDGALMARWMMPPTGFAPIVGTRFTYQTTAAGAWDGVIHCEVVDIVPQQRLSYSWRGGDAGNTAYGSPLDTLVTWLLTPDANGTRLRLVHSGFILPRNDTAYQNMSTGWRKVVRNLGDITGEQN